MMYYKVPQIIPGNGYAWTYYETDESGSVQRMLTYLSESDEITNYPNPKISTLFNPHKLMVVDELEFTDLWVRGE